MYYVYVLYSEFDGRLYIGVTGDLQIRIRQHKQGRVPSTKNRRPIRLIGYEAYLRSSDARRREKFLKGGKGRTQMKLQYKDLFKELGYRFRF